MKKSDFQKMSVEDKIVRFKNRVYSISPFISYLLAKTEWIKSDKVPTAGVDAAGRCYYSEAFVNSLSDAEGIGLTAHEVMHVALGHCLEKYADEELANIAQDIKINDILVTDNFTLPKISFIPSGHQINIPQLNYTITDILNKTSRDIYNELLREIEKKGSNPFKSGMDKLMDVIFGKAPSGGNSEGADSKDTGQGVSKDAKGKEGDSSSKSNADSLSEKSEKEVEDYWKEALSEAAVLSKRAGKLSAGMSNMVDAILTPKIPWTEKLRRFIQQDIVVDYTYRRPSRRSAALGTYYPTMLKESLQIVLHLDTSGSMSGPPLQKCLDQMYQILGAYENITVDFLMGDMVLQEHRILSKRERLEVGRMQLKGFGGTSHKFVTDWILENKPNTKILVSLTDGESDISHEYPRLPYLCNRIILLPSRGYNYEDLKQHGEVIIVDKD
jgi:predicted metal-dependent peptidase